MSGRTLTGRRVLVTGASGTFGRHLGAALTAAGARVVGLDLHARPDDDLPVLGCDLTDPDAVAAAVGAAVDQLGGLDLLINNAGVGGPAPAELPPDEVVRQQLEVNLLAAWRTTAAALPPLLTARGRVIFVASRMAVLPLPLAAAYGVSKRALVAYADALRHEVGTHVGVSVVYPSMVASPIHDSTAEAGPVPAGRVPPRARRRGGRGDPARRHRPPGAPGRGDHRPRTPGDGRRPARARAGRPAGPPYPRRPARRR